MYKVIQEQDKEQFIFEYLKKRLNLSDDILYRLTAYILFYNDNTSTKIMYNKQTDKIYLDNGCWFKVYYWLRERQTQCGCCNKWDTCNYSYIINSFRDGRDKEINVCDECSEKENTGIILQDCMQVYDDYILDYQDVFYPITHKK